MVRKRCEVFPVANEAGVNGGMKLRESHSVDFRAKFDALSSGVEPYLLLLYETARPRLHKNEHLSQIGGGDFGLQTWEV